MRLITLGDIVTLQQIIAEANALEAIQGQLDNFNPLKNSARLAKCPSRRCEKHKTQFKIMYVEAINTPVITHCPARDKNV